MISINKNKILYLDGIRGVAAFIVVIAHFLQIFYPTVFSGDSNTLHTRGYELLIAKTPLNLFINANFSVALFFVLSGFVLSASYFKHKSDLIIKKSAIKRYFRLLPPVIASLLFCFLIQQIKGFYFVKIENIAHPYMHNVYIEYHSFLTILKQGFYFVFFNYDTSTFNPALWTIKYELTGSFIVFSILFLVGNLKSRYFVYLLCLIALINTYYLAFILGIILCDISINTVIFEKLKKQTFFKGLVLFLALFLGSYPYVNTTGTIYSFMTFNSFLSLMPFYHIIGAFIILIFVQCSSFTQKIFSSKIASFLGKISFSMHAVPYPNIYIVL